MTQTSKTPIHGWIFLDKPLGVTSTKALSRVKYSVGALKAGHGGTLDPLATGLLPLAFGEATKLIPYIFNAPKVYEFQVRWGISTDTDDLEGIVTHETSVVPTGAAIEAVLPQYTGTIWQTPPRYSALKIQGQRAYDLARAGEEVILAPRLIEVHSLELLAHDPPHTTFRVTCGKGTYVRSLGREMALKLGTVGHLTQLRRTKIANFCVRDAILLDNFIGRANNHILLSQILPLRTVLDDIPAVSLTKDDSIWLRNGRCVSLAGYSINPQWEGKEVLCTTLQGDPLGIALLEKGELVPQKNFNF